MHGVGLDMDVGVYGGQITGRAFGPLHQLETRRGEKFAKPCIFPFAGVGETVKIKMPDVQRLRPGAASRSGRIGGAPPPRRSGS